MKKFNQIFFLACGLLLTLAAFPVFAQESAEFRPNKKPFDDFAQVVRGNVESKQVDLTKSFSVEMSGDLTEDGKLNPKTAKFTKGEGDVPMINVGKGFIEAVNESGLFYYLKQLGFEKINFTIGQDDNQTYAVIASEQISVARAKTIASSLDMMFKMVSMNQNGVRKLGYDEKFLISGAKTITQGKAVKINLNYEKSVLQEMVNRKLEEYEAKKPSGQ